MCSGSSSVIGLLGGGPSASRSEFLKDCRLDSLLSDSAILNSLVGIER